MYLRIGILILLFLIAGSCGSPYYISSSFQDLTREHRTVAVLPVEMIFAGNITKKLSEEDVMAIEEGESEAFQISLHKQILRSVRGGKRPFRIDFQAYATTNRLLDEYYLSVREIWAEKPEVLAERLGVDAVVRMRIEKYRYMSDLASYGITLTADLLYILGDELLWAFLPSPVTNDISTDCSLINREDGTLLWSLSRKASADWRQPSQIIIDNISDKVAKHFPYRI